MKRKICVVMFSFVLFAGGLTSAGLSQDKYPDKPVTIVVPFGPGGSSDLFFRSLTGELSKFMKVPVNVVNRTGASGLVGTDAVANSKPDGYTVLGTSSAPMTVAPAIDPKTERELDPIAILAYQVVAFTTRNESEFKNLAEVMAYAKKNPGDLTCGSSGIQTEPFFDLEILKTAAGVNIRHVSIASSSEGITSVLGGHINFWSGSLSTSYSLMKGGRIRAIAITGGKRLEEFPNVQTFAEAGFPQVNVNLVITLMGPKGLPSQVQKAWDDALKMVLVHPEVVSSLNKLHYIVDLQTGAENIRKSFKEEMARFSKIARDVGIRK